MLYCFYMLLILKMSTKTIFNVNVEREVKDQATILADKLWLSMSGVVNLLLRKFILEKRINIDLENTRATAFDFDNENIDQKEFLHYLKKA